MQAPVQIIVGSMLGATEYVADAIAEWLSTKDIESTIHLEPNLDEIDRSALWIVCSSTHGAGDLPDNIQPFAKQLASSDLGEVKAYVIGLGDSSYDTFCFGAKTLAEQLTTQGAKLIAPIQTIDVLEHPIPEEEAVALLTEVWQ